MHRGFLPPFWLYLPVDYLSVQYNGGFLPDILMLTRCNYHLATQIYPMKSFCSYILVMYGHHIYGKGKDQPGKVANPARGQLNREN